MQKLMWTAAVVLALGVASGAHAQILGYAQAHGAVQYNDAVDHQIPLDDQGDTTLSVITRKPNEPISLSFSATCSIGSPGAFVFLHLYVDGTPIQPDFGPGPYIDYVLCSGAATNLYISAARNGVAVVATPGVHVVSVHVNADFSIYPWLLGSTTLVVAH